MAHILPHKQVRIRMETSEYDWLMSYLSKHDGDPNYLNRPKHGAIMSFFKVFLREFRRGNISLPGYPSQSQPRGEHSANN